MNTPNKPYVLQFVPTAGGLGGLWTYSKIIANSSLKDKYRFGVSTVEKASKLFTPSMIMKLRKEFKECGADLLHMHDATPTVWHAMVAAKLAKFPRILITNHAFAEDLFFLTHWKKVVWREYIEPYVFRNCDGLFNVSSFGAAKPTIINNVRRNYGAINVPIPDFPVLKPDYELKKSLGFSENDYIGILVSRADKEKGWILIAEAIELLEARGMAQPKFLLVGDGPDLELTRERLKRFVEKGQVVIPGRRSDVRELNAISDFCVLPTYRDYQSSSLLEAMQQCKPVLTTKCGGNAEIVVDEITGKLISVGDSEQLFDGIKWFYEHRDEGVRMGLAGRKRVEDHFNLPTFESKLDRIYAEMLALPPQR